MMFVRVPSEMASHRSCQCSARKLCLLTTDMLYKDRLNFPNHGSPVYKKKPKKTCKVNSVPVNKRKQ